MQCALKERNNTESDIYANILVESIIIKTIKVIIETQSKTSLIAAGMLLKTLKRPMRFLLNLVLNNLLRSYQCLTFFETIT